MTDSRDPEEDSVEICYGSIYEQLGYKDHDEMETKAKLVMEISGAISKRKLTQTAAAKILGISQPKLSYLLKGRFHGYSVERLMEFLVLLGKDIDIVVKTKPKHRKARINVCHSNIRPIVQVAAKNK